MSRRTRFIDPVGVSHQRGVTLVELMVTVAINLVLVLAATLLYLNTRTTQKAVDEQGAVFETGQFALELVGRDVANAAFYPANSQEPPPPSGLDLSKVRFNHDVATQGMPGMPAAYRHGLFGCQAQAFNGKDNVCENHAAGGAAGSDSLVVSYFTNDSFSLNAGQRADCTRADVINDVTVANNPMRATHKTDGGLGLAAAMAARPDTGPQPDSPLMVINRYGLVPSTFVTESGQTINTFSLACSGNGNRGDVANRPPMVELVRGVEQFVVRYGVINGADRTPVRYLRANDVAALGNLVIDGEAEPLTAWQRVVAVRICMVVRSQSASAQRDAAGRTVARTDCFGNELPRNTGAQLRRFERVFSVKNRQGNTVAVAAQAAP
jgi:type IV pilus assembly protein PilW